MANEAEDEFEGELELGDDDGDESELTAEEAEERYLAILQSATEITAAAVSNAGAKALESPELVTELFTKVFDAIVNL